ncbi:MAG: hypothetical protein WCC66_00730 [Rhizobiaceae bacterium]
MAGLVLVSVLFGSFQALAANRTYVNPRFGTTITFPDAIFTTQDPPPENGDGARWRAPDGAELAVWGQNNVLDYTPDTLADFISQDMEKVTYRSVSARWMVVSGLIGNMIVYHRAEFGSQGVIHTMELRYPAAQAKHYDTLAGRIADSLIGP